MSYQGNFLGIQNRVRISYGKRSVGVRRFSLFCFLLCICKYNLDFVNSIDGFIYAQLAAYLANIHFAIILCTFVSASHVCLNLYRSVGKFSRRQTDDIFLTFPRKQALTFHANPKERICMKCHRFSGKNTKNVKCRLHFFSQSHIFVFVQKIVFDIYKLSHVMNHWHELLKPII